MDESSLVRPVAEFSLIAFPNLSFCVFPAQGVCLETLVIFISLLQAITRISTP